jgi:hypothetical protein
MEAGHVFRATASITYSSSTEKFVGGICGVDGTIQFIYSTDTFPRNAWYKLSLKHTTSANGKRTPISLAVNGKSEGKLTLKSFGGPAFGSAGFQVGAGNFGGSDHGPCSRNFIGSIDEVKLTGLLR